MLARVFSRAAPPPSVPKPVIEEAPASPAGSVATTLPPASSNGSIDSQPQSPHTSTPHTDASGVLPSVPSTADLAKHGLFSSALSSVTSAVSSAASAVSSVAEQALQHLPRRQPQPSAPAPTPPAASAPPSDEDPLAKTEQESLRTEILTLEIRLEDMAAEIDEVSAKLRETTKTHSDVCTKAVTPTRGLAHRVEVQHTCIGQQPVEVALRTDQVMPALTAKQTSTSIRNMVRFVRAQLGGLAWSAGSPESQVMESLHAAHALSAHPGWQRSMRLQAAAWYHAFCTKGKRTRTALASTSQASGNRVVYPRSEEETACARVAIYPAMHYTPEQRSTHTDANTQALQKLKESVLVDFQTAPADERSLMMSGTTLLHEHTYSDLDVSYPSETAKEAAHKLLEIDHERTAAQKAVRAAATQCQKSFDEKIKPSLDTLELVADVVDAVSSAQEKYAQRRGHAQAVERFADTQTYLWAENTDTALAEIKKSFETKELEIKAQLKTYKASLAARKTELDAALTSQRRKAIEAEITAIQEQCDQLTHKLAQYEVHAVLAPVHTLRPRAESCGGVVFSQLERLIETIVDERAFGRFGCHSHALKELYDALSPLVPVDEQLSARSYYTLPSRWSTASRTAEREALVAQWKKFTDVSRNKITSRPLQTALMDAEYKAFQLEFDSAESALAEIAPQYKAAAETKTRADFECHPVILYARDYSKKLRETTCTVAKAKAENIDKELEHVLRLIIADPSILYEPVRRDSTATSSVFADTLQHLLNLIADEMKSSTTSSPKDKKALSESEQRVTQIRGFLQKGVVIALTRVEFGELIRNKLATGRSSPEQSVVSHTLVASMQNSIDSLKLKGANAAVAADAWQTALDGFTDVAKKDPVKSSLFHAEASYETRVQLCTLVLNDSDLITALVSTAPVDNSASVTAFEADMKKILAGAPQPSPGSHTAGAATSAAAPHPADVLHREIRRLRSPQETAGERTLGALLKAAALEQQLKRFKREQTELLAACESTTLSAEDLKKAKLRLVHAMRKDTRLMAAITMRRTAEVGLSGRGGSGSAAEAVGSKTTTETAFDDAVAKYAGVSLQVKAAALAAGTGTVVGGGVGTAGAAALGFAMGGPPGAFVGFVAGAALTVVATRQATNAAAEAAVEHVIRYAPKPKPAVAPPPSSRGWWPWSRRLLLT